MNTINEIVLYTTSKITLIRTNVKSNEYQILVESKTCRIRNLDFYHPSSDTWIEFDEEYHNTDKQKKLDEIRTAEILKANPSLRLLRITTEEYNKNKIKTVKKCIDFISNR